MSRINVEQANRLKQQQPSIEEVYINPRTGRRISPRTRSRLLRNPITPDQCNQWRNQPTIDPVSGIPLVSRSPRSTYHQLEQICGRPSPPSQVRSMTPSIQAFTQSLAPSFTQIPESIPTPLSRQSYGQSLNQSMHGSLLSTLNQIASGLRGKFEAVIVSINPADPDFIVWEDFYSEEFPTWKTQCPLQEDPNIAKSMLYIIEVGGKVEGACIIEFRQNDVVRLIHTLTKARTMMPIVITSVINWLKRSYEGRFTILTMKCPATASIYEKLGFGLFYNQFYQLDYTGIS